MGQGAGREQSAVQAEAEAEKEKKAEEEEEQKVVVEEEIKVEEKHHHHHQRSQFEMMKNYLKALEYFEKVDKETYDRITHDLRLFILAEHVHRDANGNVIAPWGTAEQIVTYFKEKIAPYVQTHCSSGCPITHDGVFTVTLQEFSDRKEQANVKENGLGIGFFFFQLACCGKRPINTVHVHRGTIDANLDSSEKTVLSIIYLMRLTGVKKITFEDEKIWEHAKKVKSMQHLYNLDFILDLIFACTPREVNNYMQKVVRDNDKRTFHIKTIEDVSV